MMEFKVGQSIQHREKYLAGIITDHWQEPSPYRAGFIDCVKLYIILDTAEMCNSIHKTLTFNNFVGSYWEIM